MIVYVGSKPQKRTETRGDNTKEAERIKCGSEIDSGEILPQLCVEWALVDLHIG